jgi:hypothetical protein
MVRFSFIKGVFRLVSIFFISDLYQLMKEIGRMRCERPARPVLVVSMVSFLGLQETAYFLY